jgi:glutamate synthase domain-containing protein 2
VPNENYNHLKSAGKTLGLGVLGTAGAFLLGRLGFKLFLSRNVSSVLQKDYDENILELYTSNSRTNAIIVVDTGLRAQTGKALMRPLGTPFPIPDFSSMRLDASQLSHFPTANDVEVDTTLVLGKKAARPMKLDTPILIAGMAWGTALSKQAKLALAEAATRAGTATNTGSGPFTNWERAAAKHLIVQYPRAKWNHDPGILRQADMVEIQIGTGGLAGTGSKYGWDELSPEVRQAMGLKPGEDAVFHARLPEISSPRDLRALVTDLRKITGGAPIGVKMMCGNDIERDLAIVLDAEVDVISLAGGQSGVHSAPATIMDNFGLPTAYALCRAARFLERQKVRDRVSLLIGGGLESPGDFLKALALGADGVFIGTAALIAMLHNQEFKALPYEPPTQLLWYTGKLKNKFNPRDGAKHLANFIRASTEEMRLSVRALGKTALRDLSGDDMFATDEQGAKVANIIMAYRPTS